MGPGPERCHDKVVAEVREVPEESCELRPSQACTNLTQLVPFLQPSQECGQFPRQVGKTAVHMITYIQS